MSQAIAFALRIVREKDRRSVLVLALCWSLANMGNLFLILVATLAGHGLAEDKSLATLPLALGFVGLAAGIIPASLYMRQVGRRIGFVTGAVIGIIGAAIASYALYAQSFGLFCAGIVVFGFYNGFNSYYRFAASEVVAPAFKSVAISLVLAGGVVAAILGPELSKLSVDLLPTRYLGSFLMMIGFAAAMIVLVQFAAFVPPSAEETGGPARPLSAIAAQPTFIVAVMSGTVGFGVMSLLMTATPLAMVAHAHPFEQSAFVIQWHALGMYIPSFFTGSLIRRFGVLRIMIAGALLQLACVAIATTGTSIVHFFASLLLLGVGWNFLFVGGTTLLTDTHTPSERAKTQAFNDFVLYGVVGTASYFSGHLLHNLGWSWVNFTAVPAILLVMAAVFWLGWRQRTQPA